MTTVALIDDHESVRLGLEAVLVRDGMIIAYSGSTVEEYVRDLRRRSRRPADIVLLDLMLGDGTTVTENVSRLVADSAVIIHSVADRPAAVREGLAAGAAGIVSKSSPMSVVTRAVRLVASGEPLDNVEWAAAVESDTAFANAHLSERERDVLRLYAAGLPVKVVATRLGVAYSTAKENIQRVRAKYLVVGRPAPTKVDLMRRAMEDGLVDAPTDSGRHPEPTRDD
ncbi:response regulator transcription factor [Microbacterium amylolyticum]|uniref:DNA-binding NarL/FixJ family response regulator n=1 Tax=Microbacterium amylolyticum TaxID=936337 RepID=A0ABS4ZKS7_9MICO|nr:response regulator transcription factor [Microbacterium amylolyticum]MBP2437550.1 DNA-binding NarL/FixJ family response regulator [Microbacterium amylolyticum]